MAKFEALIRGALSSQNVDDSGIRAKIYQSSRNALHRMITENRSFTVEMAIAQQQELEDAIAKIEGEYTSRQVQTRSVGGEQHIAKSTSAPPKVEAQFDVSQNSIAEPEMPAPRSSLPPDVDERAHQNIEPSLNQDDPLSELQAILQENGAGPAQNVEVSSPHTNPQAQPLPPSEIETSSNLENQQINPEIEPYVDPYIQGDPSAEYYEEERKPPLGFAKRRKKQRRFIGLVVFLLIIFVLGLLGYRIFTDFIDRGLLGSNTNERQNILSRQNNREGFITILEASDPSALIVANRGSAEIITQQNSQMIRIFSARSEQNRQEAADPILLRLPPGVVEQISGQKITVEIFAKSGTTSPAQFSVECQFGAAGSCSRKRFRIGLQPEASVFAADVGDVGNSDEDLYLAINTDTTSSASITGKGDTIDIAYVRIRVN